MIILDTHAWIWHANESEKLSKTAKKVIRDADKIGVCAISCWEVAMLVSKKRLGLNMDVYDWIEKALKLPKISFIPLTPEVAVLSTRLPSDFHGDPADRMIASSCLNSQAALLTKDRRLLDYDFIESLW